MSHLCVEGYPDDNCASKQSFCATNGQRVKDNPAIFRNLWGITANITEVTNDSWNRIYTVLKNIYNYGNRGTRNPYITEGGYIEVLEANDYYESNGNQSIFYLRDKARSITIRGMRVGDIVCILPKGSSNEIVTHIGLSGGYFYSNPNYIQRVRILSVTPWFRPSGRLECYYEGNYKFSDVKDEDKILQSLYNQAVDFISTNKGISGQRIITEELMDKIQPWIDDYMLNEDRCNTCNTTCNASCEADWQCGPCNVDRQGGCEDQWGGGGGGGCSSTAAESLRITTHFSKGY